MNSQIVPKPVVLPPAKQVLNLGTKITPGVVPTHFSCRLAMGEGSAGPLVSSEVGGWA